MELGEPQAPSFTQLTRLSDEEVMAQLQAGHDDALAVLFVRYHRLVLSISLKILRDLGEAEDCAQSIFFEVFRSAAQFDPTRGTTKTWLLQYAYHRSINRKRYLRHRDFYGAAEFGDRDAKESLQEIPSTNVFLQVDAKKMLVGAIEGLTAAQRSTLEMVYFEGLTLREVAESMGEPLGNVRHYYYRGLRRLREKMTGRKKQTKPESLGQGVVDAEA